MSEKIQVALILGGRNSENFRSCQAATDVLLALQAKDYEVSAYGITMEANWISFNDLASLQNALKTDGFELNDESAKNISGTSSSLVIPDSLIDAHVVFSTMLGPWAADGTFQGLLDFTAIRYVGSDTLGTTVAFDKPTAKLLINSMEVPTPRHITITDKAWRRDPLSCIARATSLKLPIIIKPARGSNGLGVSVARFPRDLKKTIDIARQFDGRIIAEKYHKNSRLFELNIVEDEKRKPLFSEIIETKLNKKDSIFNFIYRAEKSDFSFEKATDLEVEVKNLMEEYARKVFEVLKLSGYAQIEFLIDTEGELLVQEVNTQPYLGKDGSFALSWKEAGKTYEDLLDDIIKESLERPVGLV